jgi:DnaK suppressor protein
MAMQITSRAMGVFREILRRKELELVRVLRNGDEITFDKSADPMDEIPHAAERDLTIRSLDRQSTLLRDVKASLRRIRDGGFGICMECEYPIGPKRLAAVPWASRCIQCQDAADRNGLERAESPGGTLVTAA